MTHNPHNHLMYVTEEGIADLGNNIYNNRNRYDKTGFLNYWNKVDEERYIKKFPGNIDISDLKNLSKNAKKKGRRSAETEGDIINTMKVDKIFNLNFAASFNDGIWIYLTHFYVPDYVRYRWPSDILKKHDLPSTGKLSLKEEIENKKYLDHITNHYFIGKNTSEDFKRDNAISRLFFSAKISRIYSNYSNLTFDEVVDTIYTTQDIRGAILDRSNFASQVELVGVLLEMLKKRNDAGMHTGEKPFRELMLELNNINGVFSALSDKELTSIIEGLEKIHLK